MRGNKYSVEWSQLIESAVSYQDNLKLFFGINEDEIIKNLKEALKDRGIQYYTLEVIKNLSDELIEELLEDLIYVICYSNVSNAYLSKQIIRRSNRSGFRERINEILKSFLEFYVVVSSQDNQCNILSGKRPLYCLQDIITIFFQAGGWITGRLVNNCNCRLKLSTHILQASSKMTGMTISNNKN